MPKLIDVRGNLRPETWQLFDGDAGALAANTDVVMPLDVWREYRERWLAHRGRKGVVLMPADDLAAISNDLAELAMVAVSFPVFTDGRGYSQARSLRERYHFSAEIRAVGDVLVDQLGYLRRCGIDTFALRDDQSVDAAQAALVGFSHAYQAAVNERPLFRRRMDAGPITSSGNAESMGVFGVNEPASA